VGYEGRIRKAEIRKATRVAFLNNGQSLASQGFPRQKRVYGM
jgi:hypothetical protein